MSKIIVTLLAVAGIIARFIWPELKIDSITIGLLIVASLPWLPEFIKSAKFPGGWEINFQDLKTAGEKITKGAEEEISQETPSFVLISKDDPNLGLVGLRIEIEKRVRALAKAKAFEHDRSMSYTVNKLKKEGIIDKDTCSGLHELILAGNQAAHGAIVDLKAASWAINKGPNILFALDKIIKNT